MTKEEKHLYDNGWCEIENSLWVHKDCLYVCTTRVAVDIQKLRDEKE